MRRRGREKGREIVHIFYLGINLTLALTSCNQTTIPQNCKDMLTQFHCGYVVLSSNSLISPSPSPSLVFIFLSF